VSRRRRHRRSHARENGPLTILAILGGLALVGGGVYMYTKSKAAAPAALPSTTPVALPAGNYQQSCTGCTATATSLTCTGCKDDSGNLQTSTISLPQPNGISNNNGQLVAST
jgi:hypothetical protein